MFILLIVLLALLALLGYLSSNFFRSLWILQQLKIPDHSEFPFFIEIFYPIIKLGISSPDERFRILADMCVRYPDMMKLWLGPKLVVFVNHPQKIQKVLLSQKCIDKWKMIYGFMDRENGLIAARTSVKWKEHRKFFNNSFSLSSIESFVPMFAECGDDLCDILKNQTEEVQFDFFPHAKKICFNMLCATTLGMKGQDIVGGSSYDKILDSFDMVERALNHKLEFPLLYPQTIYKLTKIRRDEKKSEQILAEFQRSILNKRRTDVKKNDRNVLIDYIINRQGYLSSKESFDHILTFMGGFETMTNALSHIALLLAIHPEIQEKLYQAIQNSITSDEDVRNTVLINSIEYLDFVVKEAFRLMPTVPLVLREVSEDFEIEPDLVIPAGVHLVINFYALHRRKDVWGDDANDFKPERFSLENADNRHIFSFLPFSAGVRICIANKYSNIALKIVVVQLVKNFKFNSTMKMQDFKLKSFISLKLCSEHLISVKARAT